MSPYCKNDRFIMCDCENALSLYHPSWCRWAFVFVRFWLIRWVRPDRRCCTRVWPSAREVHCSETCCSVQTCSSSTHSLTNRWEQTHTHLQETLMWVKDTVYFWPLEGECSQQTKAYYPLVKCDVSWSGFRVQELY